MATLMTIKITTEMLDLFGKGHSSQAAHALRKILATVTGEPVELNIYEVSEIRDLRERIVRMTEVVEEIEARGPWPEGQSRDGG